jgi:two-component sensor histidine kinase/CHASE1-domain containing sensor protein
MDKVLLARVERRARVQDFRRAGPLLLFFLITAGTLLSVRGLERAESARQQAELEGHATEIAAALTRRATEHTALLHAAAAVFSTDRQVEPEEFRNLATGMRQSGAYHGSLGVVWAVAIPPSAVPAFEQQLIDADSASYRVFPRPSPQAKSVVPVVFVDPPTPNNRLAVGFDMYSDPVRRQAMDAAARSGQPWASGKVELVHGNGSGFLIFMPVFRQEGERRQLKGFVLSPFRATDFLSAAAELYGARKIQVSIYDGGKTDEDLLVGPTIDTTTGPSVDRKVLMAQRPWILSVGMERQPVLSPLSRATLIFGMILAVLAAALARVITNRAAEDRQVLEWLSRQSGIRTSLTRELNHRVKNTLANVLSIVALTRRQATDIDEFAESLTDRLRALSATHDLLSQSDWRGAPIHQLVRTELAPYLDDDGSRVSMEGPEIDLASNEALSLGLAIHELATNAAKYGALSTSHGTVSVKWALESPEMAELVWQEMGGPQVSPPTRRGFGVELIERIVAQELNAKVDLDFLPTGVRCRLCVPLRKRGDFNLRRSREQSVFQ